MAKVNIDRMTSDMKTCIGWPYVSPGCTDKDCSKSGIDCSGMFVRAFKLQGAKIYHGSNTIWREYTTDDKGCLTNVNQLAPGMAVFKWRAGTPSKFSDDLGDFHHIGYVASVNPLQIIHASTVGYIVKVDTSISAWTHYAKLKKVDYPEDYAVNSDTDSSADNAAESTTGEILTVAASGGSTVFLRVSASRQASYIERVPIGDTVQKIKSVPNWTKVKHGSKTGWMMTKFLKS